MSLRDYFKTSPLSQDSDNKPETDSFAAQRGHEAHSTGAPAPSGRDDYAHDVPQSPAENQAIYDDRSERSLNELIGEAGDEDDLLGVDRQLQELSDRLLTKLFDRDQREPFVIGLYGEWGSGKSFWQKQIRYKLLQRVYCEEGQDSCLVVPIEFNAWRYEKEDNLIVPLLKTTVSELERWRQLQESDVSKDWDWKAHLGRIASEIRVTAAALDYAGSVRADESRLLEALRQAAASNGGQDPTSPVDASLLESRYIDFQDNIKRLLDVDEPDGSKMVRLVFFIDDLDRCLPDKAIEMLEALKLFLDIEGTAYVMAIDDEVVDRGILHRYSYLQSLENQDAKQLAPITGDEYLEKIIHLQVHLDGTADDNRIMEFVNDKCPELMALDSLELPEHQTASQDEDEDSDDSEEGGSDLSFRAFLEDFPKVPRKLIRLNELYQLRKNVLQLSDPEDRLILLRMVALQLFVPRVYRSAIRRNVPDILNLMGHWREKYREQWPNFAQLLARLEEDSAQLQGPELHRWLHVTEPLLQELADVQGQRAAFDPSILAWPYAIAGSWLRFVEGEPAAHQLRAGDTYLSLSESELQEIFASLLSEAPSSWRETMSRAPRGRFFAKDHQKQLLEALKVRRHGAWGAMLKREWLTLVGPFLSKAKFEEALKKLKVGETTSACREGREVEQSLLECWLISHLDDVSPQQLIDWSQKLSAVKQANLREQWLADNTELDSSMLQDAAVDLKLPDWGDADKLVYIVEQDESPERRHRAAQVLRVLGDPRPEDARGDASIEEQGAATDSTGVDAADKDSNVAALDDVGEFADEEEPGADESMESDEQEERARADVEEADDVAESNDSAEPEVDQEALNENSLSQYDAESERELRELLADDNVTDSQYDEAEPVATEEIAVESLEDSDVPPTAAEEEADEDEVIDEEAEDNSAETNEAAIADAEDNAAAEDLEDGADETDNSDASVAQSEDEFEDESPVDAAAEGDLADDEVEDDAIGDDDYALDGDAGSEDESDAAADEEELDTDAAEANTEEESVEQDDADEIDQAEAAARLAADAAIIAELDDRETEPMRRLEIGDELNETGDPRAGVGLGADGKPDIDWIWVPPASGILIDMGEEDPEPWDVAGFLMSRYPVTNAQFEAFLRAEGYDERSSWWKDLQPVEMAESEWPHGNRPRTNVSWFEAAAYCRWLSALLSRDITLPTEAQWLAAAAGSEGRLYPWGDGVPVSQRANVIGDSEDEESPEQTSAVGLYPAGVSPEGVADLAGNVLEWCLNKFEAPCAPTLDDSEDARVLRGGSWRFDGERAQSDTRGRFAPDGQLAYVGFRLVCIADPVGQAKN